MPLDAVDGVYASRRPFLRGGGFPGQAIWGSQSAVRRLLSKFNEAGDVNDLYETGKQPDEKTITIIVYQLIPITNSTRVSQYVVCKNFIAVSETAQISNTDHEIWFSNK